jgi:hypothetical protein
MKNICNGLFIATFLGNIVQAQTYTGCVLDENIYQKAPLAITLSRGDYDNLPKAHSLRKYAPVPQNQGAYGTCVGWATAYAARTIQMAHRQNWTNTQLITENALSPFFVYESAKPSSDIYCQEGTSLYNGLEILKSTGSVKVFDYPNQCGQNIPKTLEKKATQFKIKDFRRLFDREVKDKAQFVKKSIAENNPVVIGLQCCAESFQNAKGINYWQLKPTDNATPQGGHALTVIGYDDNFEGGKGAFELMNSWGTEWGKGGFIWMNYEDFNKYCFEAYEMTLPEMDMHQLAGTVKLELSAGEAMPFYFKNGVYESKESYHSGTMFRIVTTNQESMYLYAIGSDLKNQDYKIFPTQDRTSTLMDYKNSKVSLPSERNYIQMDNLAGTDFICLLYSKDELQIDYILHTLQNETGTLPERVKKVYGERLFNPQEIDRSDKLQEIAFKASSKNRSIVPVFITIQHID